jgi:nucleotide sugar dehydrogenase
VLDAEVLPVANAETAEFTKLAETTYRDVNIALANEFARFADQSGVDALQAIDAANTQPFSHIHRPGVGVGGHCIPVYPYFYANRTEHAEIARMARRINDGMAEYAVERLENELGDLRTRRVAILGYAYREDVKEDSFTVAARLVRLLEQRRAHVLVHDSLYSKEELLERHLEPYDLADPGWTDAVVLQAAHQDYRDLDLGRIPGLRVVVDGRNSIDRSMLPASVRYIGIGRIGSVPVAASIGADRDQTVSANA